MTVRRLAVLLQTERIGCIERTTHGRLRFSYDDGWRRRTDATPLSLSMPLAMANHADPVVSAFLWGLLPDNDLVLRRWGSRFHVSPRNPFSLLSTPIGLDCAGAVQLVPDGDDLPSGRLGDIEWLTDHDVAERLRELRRDATTWLPDHDTGQFSLAGAQAKTALLFDEHRQRWALPSGSLPTTHILKPAIQGLDDHDLNEHLCLAAARRLGLRAVETSVRRFEDVTAIVVRRYDRLRHDGRWLRLHQEDLCQALGFPPTEKYQNDGGPTPRQIVALLRARVRPRAEADAQVWRFVEALMLNWLIVGTDAHAKNYAVLLAGSQVRLAPLYDVASVLPYETDVRRQKMAMKVGGAYRVELIGERQWKKLASELSLNEGAVLERLRELADRLPEALHDVSRTREVSQLRSPLPARLVDAVAERATWCRRWL